MCINVTCMKKSFILILIAVVLTVTGCDFFRKVAGRPTSQDIEKRKAQIAIVEKQREEQAREQARLDSIRVAKEQIRLAEEKAAKDSLDALSSLKAKGCMMYDLASLKGISEGNLHHRYYIVVGSFRDANNADKFMKKVSKDVDMEPLKVRFRNGMVAVGVCPRNEIVQIASVIDEVRTKSFCPKDAWILVNEE